ncbi:hypothetical protein EV702DRAFT_1083291 [Suillus placidus]|uniref:Uncharacterized protein n=1 Tax=Suillus placidus TaxID=48579 RepID=A0A9P6ZZZ1_9AGAM|nr:hypothetical protein EV702DRAFT_1083291 [Suillus placidus]
MKPVQFVYLTILAAASVAASATPSFSENFPQPSELCQSDPCSSRPPSNCESGMAPYRVNPECWMCCRPLT